MNNFLIAPRPLAPRENINNIMFQLVRATCINSNYNPLSPFVDAILCYGKRAEYSPASYRELASDEIKYFDDR